MLGKRGTPGEGQQRSGAADFLAEACPPNPWRCLHGPMDLSEDKAKI
jgi:hypothetical protein